MAWSRLFVASLIRAPTSCSGPFWGVQKHPAKVKWDIIWIRFYGCTSLTKQRGQLFVIWKSYFDDFLTYLGFWISEIGPVVPEILTKTIIDKKKAFYHLRMRRLRTNEFRWHHESWPYLHTLSWHAGRLLGLVKLGVPLNWHLAGRKCSGFSFLLQHTKLSSRRRVNNILQSFQLESADLFWPSSLITRENHKFPQWFRNSRVDIRFENEKYFVLSCFH